MKESQTTEFKKSLAERKEILETISAFANSRGGKIFVGIDENKDGSVKKIVGIKIRGKEIENLSNEIKQNMDPVIYPSIEVKKIKEKSVLVVEIKESQVKPVFVKIDRIPVAFKRVGKANQKIDVNELRQILSEGKEFLWDSQICEEATLGDIDEEKVRWFLKEARKQRGLKILEEAYLEEVLMKLKLLRNGKLTNAAVLLFSKEPMFLQSEVKCIRFSGNKPVKPYIDFQTLEGNVFDLIDNARDFVLRNIRKAIWLVPEKVQREERYEYPPDAIREAIVNAVVHRDYGSPSKVQVRIFDNRIEIWSPGTLPKEISIEDLKKEHSSIPRNPLLFKQLFWVKYVEDVGSGTLDMIDQCKEWNIPEPEFEHITGSFAVIFKLPPVLEDLHRLGLNERQIKAINYVIKQGSITNREYTSLTNISRKMATIDLTDLVEKGLLIRVGEGKRGLKYILSGLRKDYAKDYAKE
ncbi:MAG: putative DNA binding domain-containing protein [Candidatus Altiarchaeota archaeon]|nr:putative DNA binding domain-containing protein [Candidatus Altiarchaeota archaeon]